MTSETTAALLARVRDGDAAAKDLLAARYLSLLTQWAHQRLPAYARGSGDTDDLVQVTLMKALDRVHTFEPRREGAFLMYLRAILMNEIRQQIRKAGRVRKDSLSTGLEADTPSPLERMMEREVLEQYEQSLEALSSEQREAVILRLEFGFTYREIAEALGRSTWNSTRMMISRALLRLGKAMNG